MIGSYTEGDEPVPGLRLIRVLGWGQFGQVWKASAPGGTEVALKIVNLSDRQTLKELKNIRRVRQVRHPNLVSLVAFWLKDRQGNMLDEELLQEDDSGQQAIELLIAMSLGDKTLADRLQECQEEGHYGIPPQELLGQIDDVARALDYLNQSIHDLGNGPVAIQHCDIKPQNILLVGGAAQVCDLGVIRVVGELRNSAAMATAAYVAPEILSGGQPSRTTDQYSLAIMYHELRTGFLPLNAKSMARAFLAHLHGDLDFSRLSEEERVVVRRATSLDPEQRFPTCQSFSAALRLACAEILRSFPARAPAKRSITARDLDLAEEEESAKPAEKPAVVLAPVGRPTSQADRPTLLVPQLGLDKDARRTPPSEDDFPVFNPPARQAARVEPRLELTAAARPNDQAPAPVVAPSASRPQRVTWRIALPPALCAGIMVGTLSSWIGRHSAPAMADTPVSQTEVAATAPPPPPSQVVPRLEPIRIPAPVHEPAAPVQIAGHVQVHEPAAPVQIAGHVQGFRNLPEAIAATKDGDLVTLHTNGPFMMPPLEIRGKALTLKAAPGCRPVLTRSSQSDSRWQAFLATDRPLTLEGLDIRDDHSGVIVAAGEPAYLVMADGAPLRLRDCRLLAPRGAAAIVCRDPGELEVRDCWFVVDQLAICVELAQRPHAEILLTGNSIRVEASGGAALSIWGTEAQSQAAARIHLERNTVASGRLAAFKNLPGGVEVSARENDLVFREALVSYVGFIGETSWRRATVWKGHANRYHGPADWVQLDGRPAGILGLSQWRHTFGSPETGSLSSTVVAPRDP